MPSPSRWQFSIEGSGQLIGGALDAFQYAYKSFTGDGEIIARVASVEPITGYARAGIMFREGLQPDARNVFMSITDGGRARYQYRSTSGGDTSYTETGTGYSAPYYVKVVRTGNSFSGWVSAVGGSATNWAQIGSTATIAMSSKLYVGLALSAAAYGTLNNSTFDNVKIQPSGAPTNLIATAVHAKRIDLAWTDNSLGEDGFEVERSSDGTNYALIGFATGSNYSDQDSQLNASLTYHYRVRAFNDSGVEGAPDGYSDYNTNGTGYTGSNIATTNGLGNGLSVRFYNSFDTQTAPPADISQSVNYFWGSASPALGIDPHTYLADWSGQIKVDTAGTYTFYTYSDDGVRLWVNDQLVVNNWSIHEPTENSGTVTFNAAGTYNIRIEYYQNYGTATMRLSYSGPGVSKQVIPTWALYSTGNTSAATGIPTGLSATSGVGGVDLAWNGVDEADYYAIYRSSDSGQSYQFLAWSTANSFHDSSAVISTGYFYKVLSGGAGGRSALSTGALSSWVGGTNSAFMAIGAVVSGNVASLTLGDSNTSVNLYSKWFVDWGDGHSQTVDGTVAADADKIVNHVFHTPGTSTAAYTIQAFAYLNGEVYHRLALPVQVTAPASAPAAPTGLTATQTSGSTIEVKWTGATGATTNRASSYLIERSTNGTNWTTAGTADQTRSSFTDEYAFQGGTTYYYRVTGSNAIGSTSASTNAAQFSVGTPNAPTGVSVLSAGAHTLRISWADNSNDEKGFTVYARPGTSGSFLPIATTPPNRNFASIPDADPSTQYQVNVVANGATGQSDSAASANASGTTTAASSSDQTTKYKVKLISDNSHNGDLTIGNANYKNTTGSITWESDAIDGEGNPKWISAESWEDAIYRSVFDAVFKVTDAGPYSYSWKDLLYVASGTNTAFRLEKDHPSGTGAEDDKKTYYLAIEDKYQHGSDEDYNDGYFTFEVTKSVVCGDCEQGASEALGTDTQSTPSLPALSGGSGLTPAPVVTNNPAVAGSGSQSPTFPTLRRVEDSIILRSPSGSTRFFEENGASYRTAYDYKESLATGANATLVMTRPDGSSYTFHDFSPGTPGQFKSYEDSAGNVTSVAARDGSNRITDIEHTVLGGTAVEGYHYTYGTGADADRVVAVSFRRKPDAATAWNDAQHLVRKVEYTYTPAGDLKLAELKDKNGNLIDGSYFRYYGFGETNGYNHMAKLAFGPQSLARLKAAFPTDWDTRSDADVKPYADAYYEYDRSGRVTLKTSQGEGCSSCSGGLGTYKYEFTSKNNDLDDLNAWVSKTVEYLPDATSSDWTDNDRNVHYYNSAGRSILDLFHETSTGNEWATYHRFDNDGREILTAQPSAVSGYDETKPDLLNNVNGNYVYLRDNQGVIETTQYYDATTATATLAGDAAGYFAQSFVQQGELGTGVLQSSVNYFKQSDANGNSIYPVASSTVYGNDNGTDARTTRYQYSFDGQLDHTDSYFSLSGQTYGTGTNLGTLGTHFLRSSYAYDQRGRQSRVQTPDGTITRTLYDGLNRVTSTWKGTDDEPTSGTWSPTNTAGTNLLKISENVYDGGGIGDSNLTKSKSFFGSNTSDFYAGDYQYDFRNRMIQSRGPDNVATKYTLNNLGEATTTQTYADANQDFVLATWEQRGKSQNFYDSQGRVFRTIQHEVNPTNGAVGNRLTSNVWYNARGMQAKSSAPNGLFSKTAFDGAGRPVASYTSYDSSETSYADALTVSSDTVIEQVKRIYDAASNVVTSTTYSRLDGVTTDPGELGAATNKAYIQTAVSWYDKANRPIASANYGRDDGGTRYVFNTSGNLIDSDADGIPDEAENSPRTPNSSDDYIVSKVEYNDAGRVFRTTDNKGLVSQTEYDLLGRTVKTIANVPGTNSAAVETDTDQRQTTEYIYDSAGRLSKQRARNPKGSGNGIQDQDTTYLYESPIDGSWVTSTIYPDSTDTTSSGSDQVKQTFNRLGRVLTTTDQRGVVHTYSYDSAGRLSSDAVTTLPAGVDGSIRRIDYGFDDLSRQQTVTSYDATGSNAAIVNQVKWTYNGWGQVSKSQQSHSGAVTSTTAAVKYAYEDGAGADKEAKYVRLGSMAYPSGRIIYYNYPTSGVGSYLNRVDNIANDSAGSTKYAQYTYLGSGTITAVSHPGVTGGLNLSYGSAGTYAGWDRFGRVIRQEWKNDAGTSTKDGYVYTYDRNSNRTSKDVTSTSAPTNLDETYSYDGLDRLLGFKRGTLSGTNITTSTYTQDWSTLDSLGNWRTFVQDNDGSGAGTANTQTRTSNLANETGTISGSGMDWIDPVYDAAGNMTSGPKAGAETTRLHYVYDAWNRLVAVKNDNAGNPATTLSTYTYDGLGRRVSKVTGGNTDDSYYNEGWQLLDVRRNGDVDALEQYVWDLRYIDAPVVRMRDTNVDGFVDETLYYTNDANMNVTALVDTAGTVQERYVYEPFGKVAFYNGSWTSLGSSAKLNSILYTGSRFDSETGLNLMRWRYQQPNLGWIQRDFAGYIDGANLYQYVQSEPISRRDPLGLRSYLEAAGNDVTIVVKVNFLWDECDSRPGNSLQEARRQAEFHANAAQEWWSAMLANHMLVQRSLGGLKVGNINFRLEHKFTIINSQEIIKTTPNSRNRGFDPASTSKWLRESWTAGIAENIEAINGEGYHLVLLDVGPGKPNAWSNQPVTGPHIDRPVRIEWTGTDQTTFTHETGHLMGLLDHYVPFSNPTRPMDGWPKTIMSDGTTKQVTSGQVRAILETLNDTELPHGNFGVVLKGVDVSKLDVLSSFFFFNLLDKPTP